ncbi:hypothetical protein E2C01_071019 [Portunus trituberculatus]|uniref:Uncharacterized protein n=1 Tax=Portunus trituberculatus TaxID=210409 RepID=A0A5B7HYW6_PORTR|nr:hypothetical protein [Portunus trituberculatus]
MTKVVSFYILPRCLSLCS